MSQYFDHTYVSNSDLKELADLDRGIEKPANIREIYDAGTLNHWALCEPYKASDWLELKKKELSHDQVARHTAIAQYELACLMADTVLRDELCRQVILAPDFKREHEFYRIRNPWGLEGVRCKCDGVSTFYRVVFEYKCLGITTENAFDEALRHFDYDQSAVWYLETTRLDIYLIVGVSKKYPRRLFKRVIDLRHVLYQSGYAKCSQRVRLWKSYGLK